MGNHTPNDPARPDDHAKVRELPKVHTTANTAHKSQTRQPLSGSEHQDPEEAKAAMAAYNRDVQARMAEVRESLEGFPDQINPLGDPDFQAFIRSHLAYGNMVYITTGRFPADARHGGPVRDGGESEHFSPSTISGLDPVLGESPAARAAIEAGADLTGESDDD
mgnify:CR=1 FL=1